MKSAMISTLKLSGKAASAILLGFIISGCAPKEEVLGLHQTGTMAFMLNCDQAASTYFEKAIKSNPEYGPSYIMLGDCYLREGKPEKAVKVIEKGLQYTTDEGHLRLAHRKLARAYRDIGETDKARPQMVEYIKLSVLQGKFDESRKTESEEFLRSLNLTENNKVDVDSIVAEYSAKRKQMIADHTQKHLENGARHKESKDVTGAIADLLGL